MNKGPIAWFTQNHVAANLLMFMVVVGGLLTLFNIKVETFPEFSMDRITVTVEYPGASPSEIEDSIIKQIEEKISGLDGIRELSAAAMEGRGTVSIEVEDGWDTKKLLDEVKSEVDRITTLPEQAEKPLVKELTRRSSVISVAIFGDVPEITLKNLAQKIRDDLTDTPEITQAELFGVRNEEVHIEITEENLRRYGLTLGQVAAIVKNSSLDLPAGSIKTKGGEILVRTKGRRYTAAEYRDVSVITKADGSRVTLGQIANLRDGFEDTDIYARFQGQRSAQVQVFRVGDQNAITVADAVKRYIEKIKPTLPAGVGIETYRDMSTVLKSRIDLLLRNMSMGLILVALVLGLVLNIKLAFWVTLGIPISFLCALWALPMFDISINMVSLFAFLLVLGIVVDDAIVVGENIYHHVEQGKDRLTAAVVGTIEMAHPVVFSVLTTVAAFLPLWFAGGMMGKVLKALPVVVTMVLLASLLESFLVLPSHIYYTKIKANKDKKRPGWFSTRLESFIQGPYRNFLRFGLRWRYAVVCLGLAMLLVTLGTFVGGRLKFSMMPHVEADFMTCSITLPPGTSVERTEMIVNRVEKAARAALDKADAEVWKKVREKEGDKAAKPESVFQQSISLIGLILAGQGPRAGAADLGSNKGMVIIQLLDGEKRQVGSERLARMWRKEVGVIPEAKSVSFVSALFQAGNPIEVHLSAKKDETLTAAADRLKSRIRELPGATDIADSFLPGKQEMQLALKPAARSLGLTLSDLASQVRHAFYGAEALRLVRNENEVKVMVRYPEAQRRSLANIEDMRIRTPTGDEVPFHQVAQVTMQRGYSIIERVKQKRVVKVTADVDTAQANANELRQVLSMEIMPLISREFSGLRYTMEGEAKEQRESMSGVIQGFGLALFFIYALLAVPFRSFSQPLIVMLAIPFGLVGAVFGHLLMGLNFSMLSMFGAVGLSGVVVNDSLVLVHAANTYRREGGQSAFEAVANAGVRRFRPIMLTTITTFAGLMPMIFERSMQAQFLIPMAVSLGFGVLFATLITLVLIPCGYLMMDDAHNLTSKMRTAVFGKKADAH